jgi:phage terminase small subunit
MADLNDKQKRFVAEYLIDLNATQAAIRAGYSAKTAHVQGSRLLSDVRVSALLTEKQTKLADKLEVTAERVIRELALIGFANMLDYITTTDSGEAFVDLSKLTREQAAAITEVTSEVYMEGKGDEATPVKRTKFKLSDERAALVDLGKHLGLFKQEIEVTIREGLPNQLEAARRRVSQAQTRLN